jgi:site-specific recombinase XerD
MTTKASPVRVTGPLAEYADGFRAALAGTGYTPLSAANQLRLMAHLSRWLAGEHLVPMELTDERLDAYLAHRRLRGYTCWLSRRGLRPLVGHLRGVGVVPPPEVALATPVEVLLSHYRDFLLQERGLSTRTVAWSERVARQFLTERAHGGDLCLDTLVAADVAAFVVAVCTRRSVGSAKLVVTGLRSLLRFLHLTGRMEADLASAVPAVAGWRGASLPRALPAAQVRLLLASCDRRRATGRRDFAILLLLARLGLRAAEVAGLELGDLDWRAGELVVVGKGRRHERLPLPADVGQAIVGYLRRGRPRTTQRALFLRAKAPQGRLSGAGVQGVVRSACARASLPPVGAHRLRHTLAAELLRAGATLGEVGQVLRHRSPSTTTIYAKVDRVALRPLALPWPGSRA